MTSANEHFLPTQKAKLSPLDLRNSDLVSRLLAATPPYLYNMNLLPNTYFFSEMLRSFVQAKNEQSLQRNNLNFHPTMRRPRKRAWPSSIRQENVQLEPKIEHNEPWMLKSNKKMEETALELTTNGKEEEVKPKIDENQSNFASNQENPSNLVLPPAPPMWYPPIYPTPPYGIDPLHFFIDLRVSGHIYDKQNTDNNKESIVTNNNSPSTIVSQESCEKIDVDNRDNTPVKLEDYKDTIFREKRQSSAFSVPVPQKQTKFDVKSMGFDKNSNKTSTNYIMNNITGIYKNLEGGKESINVNFNEERHLNDEDPSDRNIKDLKALFGFRLNENFTDKNKNVNEARNMDSDVTSSDIESVGSPNLDVVALNDDF